jgi:aryl-alcohol dehydrogenase-like predicted oxidoreductase
MKVERRQFGKTDMKVSILGFGGAEIGYQQASPKDVERLLNSAFDAGLNVIDTAECYMESEELIGQAVSHRRQDYYLFTKCGHARGFDLSDWDPKLIEKSIDRSLQRLRTDYVDVIHLHSCSEEILRRGEVIEVLQKAKQAGKTRYIGYSGDKQDALYAIELGVFDSFETSVNIADQEAIDLTIPRAVERGLGVIAKRPVANAAWLSKERPQSEYNVPYWERLRELNYAFTQGDTTAASSVATALRFTLSIPGVHTAIVGTQNPDRYQQNAQILAEGLLDESQYKAIRDQWKAIAKADWVGQI